MNNIHEFMKYTTEELEYIAKMTGHDCHLCHQPIEFNAYADVTHPNGWEVDHVRPKSKRGHDGFSNLRAAHTSCNRMKGNRSNRSVRSKHGVVGMPPSTFKRFMKGIGYVAFAIGGIWVLSKIFAPERSPQPVN